jgi:protein-tyrosine phosphatase
MIKVLFVCHGNICRSPTAEGVFRKIVKDNNCESRFHIDSSGIIDHHEGQPPDRRSAATAQKKGYDLSYIRSRPVEREDFTEFDFILAMDQSNMQNLIELCPDHVDSKKMQLFLNFSEKFKGQSVPDPYYGGADGFEKVLQMCEEASIGLYTYLVNRIPE